MSELFDCAQRHLGKFPKIVYKYIIIQILPCEFICFEFLYSPLSPEVLSSGSSSIDDNDIDR